MKIRFAIAAVLTILIFQNCSEPWKASEVVDLNSGVFAKQTSGCVDKDSLTKVCALQVGFSGVENRNIKVSLYDTNEQEIFANCFSDVQAGATTEHQLVSPGENGVLLPNDLDASWIIIESTEILNDGSCGAPDPVPLLNTEISVSSSFGPTITPLSSTTTSLNASTTSLSWTTAPLMTACKVFEFSDLIEANLADQSQHCSGWNGSSTVSSPPFFPGTPMGIGKVFCEYESRGPNQGYCQCYREHSVAVIGQDCPANTGRPLPIPAPDQTCHSGAPCLCHYCHPISGLRLATDVIGVNLCSYGCVASVDDPTLVSCPQTNSAGQVLCNP